MTSTVNLIGLRFEATDSRGAIFFLDCFVCSDELNEK